MGLEVVPERQSELLLVRWRACPYVGEQGAPRVGHAAADALEVEAKMPRRVEQPLGGLVQREPAGCCL
jgi:hypothetical protein